jgi:hypothetical protein
MASLVKPLKTCSHRDLGWDGAKDSDFNGHVDTTKRETYFAPVGHRGAHGRWGGPWWGWLVAAKEGRAGVRGGRRGGHDEEGGR